MGAHGTMHHTNGLIEDNLVELRNHLSLRKFTQIPSGTTARRTLRGDFGQFGEIRSGFDLVFNAQAFFFGFYENVSRSSFHHHGRSLNGKRSR